jgi:hypothetical protein
MSPAKKKKAVAKPKPPPEPAPPVLMPKPELPPKQRRFFAVVNRKNAIGFWLISLGSAFCLGYILTDKAHLHEKVVLWAGGIMILFGAHFLSSEPTEKAMIAVGRAVKGVMPGRSDDQPPSGQ